MFRKIWQRLTRTGDYASGSASTARENRRESSIDFPNADNLPFYWLDRNTGASHLIETPEELVNLHIYRGDIYYQNGEYTEALTHFDEAIRVIFGTSYPGQKYAVAALAYGKRGNVYFNTGNYDKAIEDYDRAIKLEPDIFAASPLYVGRGRAFIRRGENDKAIQDLDTAISLGVRSAEAYFGRGHAYTNIGEFDKAAEDFSKANELDSEFVSAYMTGVYGVERDDHNRVCSPYEIIGRIRENNIGLGVIDFISAIGSQRGFPEALVNSTLGMAAAGVSSYVAGADVSPEQVRAVFSRRVSQSEYNGWAVAPYFRKVFPMDTLDAKIIADMTDVLSRQLDDVAYEDFGLGISHGYPYNDHSSFGVCIVMGVGCTDGSAYALARINEARVASDADPLKNDEHLRTLTRKYIEIEREPEEMSDEVSEDILQSGYVPDGFRVRLAHNGAFCPIPEDMDANNLTYEQLGNLAAEGILRKEKETLLRPDWQDIGVAIRIVSFAPGIPMPAVQAEFLIAWRIPADSERPAHFPPPIGEPKAD